MRRPPHCKLIALLLIAMFASAAAPATTPTTKPDPHVWAKRNAELIRQATTRNAHPRGSGGIETALGFSLEYNPMLSREPYRGQILQMLEDALAKKDIAPEVRREMKSSLISLRRVASTKATTKSWQDHETDDAKERQIKMRDAGNWAELAGSYLDSATKEWARKRPAHAARNFVALLALLRQHPPAGDSDMAGSLRRSAYSLAKLAMEMDRKPRLDTLMPSFPQPLRVELLLGYACAHIEGGRVDQARVVIETHVRPLAPAIAEHLTAYMDGKAPAPLVPRPTTAEVVASIRAATRGAASRPAEHPTRLDYVIAIIANHHASRGQIETAERQLRVYGQELKYYRLAGLAQLAGEAGHHDAAAAAFERAIELAKTDSVMTADEYAEEAAFVREAVKLRLYDVASGMLNTTADPGAGVRHALANAYLARGDHARADALIDEAIKVARDKGRGDGDVMADIAVDLHAAGQRERAEKLLLDAMDHIEGVDFGFSGTAAIVRAAMKMNRLDLLDRCFESYDDPGEKMLLCIVASRAGLYGDTAGEED